MTRALALTDYGVEEVALLDPETLKKLAKFLCDANVHEANATEVSNEAWERQEAANGGYCDFCRDFAGKVMAKFEVDCEVES
jgi:hypothetical protein